VQLHCSLIALQYYSFNQKWSYWVIEHWEHCRGEAVLVNCIYCSVTTLYAIEEQSPYLCMDFSLKVRVGHWVHGALFFLLENYHQARSVPIPLPVLCGLWSWRAGLKLLFCVWPRSGHWVQHWQNWLEVRSSSWWPSCPIRPLVWVPPSQFSPNLWLKAEQLSVGNSTLHSWLRRM
jgi:hypothetical protein